jgi:thiol-disulfide isomerase/thioredoxin
MKHTYIILLITFIFSSCNLEKPTQFSEVALQDNFITLQGEDILLKDILNQYKGKTILIDVWASWCRDCIEGMPTVKKLQEKFPDVVFLFLSEDRSISSWKRGIQKYQVKGNHYFIEKGAKGDFANFLNSNWIPRYMVVDSQGSIKLFKATKATDIKIKEALKE